jgi:hypothetical protein
MSKNTIRQCRKALQDYDDTSMADLLDFSGQREQDEVNLTATDAEGSSADDSILPFRPWLRLITE